MKEDYEYDAERGRYKPLNALVERPECPLMRDVLLGPKSDPQVKLCNAPLLRSLLPANERSQCARAGKCLVSAIDKAYREDHPGQPSMMSVCHLNEYQKYTPVPVDAYREYIRRKSADGSLA